jgi:hypothetical protein
LRVGEVADGALLASVVQQNVVPNNTAVSAGVDVSAVGAAHYRTHLAQPRGGVDGVAVGDIAGVADLESRTHRAVGQSAGIAKVVGGVEQVVGGDVACGALGERGADCAFHQSAGLAVESCRVDELVRQRIAIAAGASTVQVVGAGGVATGAGSQSPTNEAVRECAGVASVGAAVCEAADRT